MHKKSSETKRNQKGFTLIELLVVISIMALLSSIILVTNRKVRATSRDAQRIATLQQIQKALEFYYEDNGHYPDSTTYPDFLFWPHISALQPYLDPYMGTIPDNIGVLNAYYVAAPRDDYLITGGAPCIRLNAGAYLMMLELEKPNPITTQDVGADPTTYDIAGGSYKIGGNCSTL